MGLGLAKGPPTTQVRAPRRQGVRVRRDKVRKGKGARMVRAGLKRVKGLTFSLNRVHVSHHPPPSRALRVWMAVADSGDHRVAGPIRQ